MLYDISHDFDHFKMKLGVKIFNILKTKYYPTIIIIIIFVLIICK
jgi:hypothetical protein